MSKHISKEFAGKWSALGAGTKAAVIVAASTVAVGGISLPIYLDHQNQQALLLAEQQEQERLATEQSEAERIAAEEEQTLLDAESQAEADRLAVEEEAYRLEAERMEQKRIAAEEEQAQAEADRIAAEEAAEAEQARQQAEAAAQQQAANQNSSDDIVIPNTNAANEPSHPENRDSGIQRQYREEPTSGEAYEMAQRVGAVWDPELEGWVYIDMGGDRVFIYYSGGSKVLYD